MQEALAANQPIFRRIPYYGMEVVWNPKTYQMKKPFFKNSTSHRTCWSNVTPPIANAQLVVSHHPGTCVAWWRRAHHRSIPSWWRHRRRHKARSSNDTEPMHQSSEDSTLHGKLFSRKHRNCLHSPHFWWFLKSKDSHLSCFVYNRCIRRCLLLSAPHAKQGWASRLDPQNPGPSFMVMDFGLMIS